MSITGGILQGAPSSGSGGLSLFAPPTGTPSNGANTGTDYTASVWGAVIPISQGFRAINSAIVWAGPITKTNIRSSYTPPPPGSTVGISDTAWDLTQSFAISVGKRLNKNDPPPLVRRVWADGTLVYANGENMPLAWGGLKEGYVLNGQWINGVWVPNPSTPNAPPQPIGENGATTPLAPVMSNLTFRFYHGDEDQLPDQALVDDLGDLAPAFRGLMYMVIDGLIVGSGTDFVPDSGQGQLHAQKAVPTSFPVITVELADGDDETLSLHDFTTLGDSVPLQFGDEVVMANWTTREIAVIAPSTTTLGTLHLYDIDSATEKSSTVLTGSGTDTVGPTAGFAVWDEKFDLFYTERAGDNCICSVNRQGAIVSTALQIGTNLAPFNVDSTTITDAKPAIGFPRPVYGDIGYVVKGGFPWPLVLAGNAWVAAFAPKQDGTLKSVLHPSEFYQSSSTINSVQVLPLFKDVSNIRYVTGFTGQSGLINGSSYQDTCFVVGKVDGVDLVYATLAVDGSGVSTASILAVHSIYTAQLGSGGKCWAFLDKTGQVCVWEFKVGTGGLFSKIKIDYSQPNDLSIAPSFKGIYPKPGGVLRQVGPQNGSGVAELEGNSAKYSNVSADTLLQQGMLLNLVSGTFTLSSILNGAGSTTDVWDSAPQVMYFHGNISGGQASGFTGGGMRFGQVYQGIASGAEMLKDVIKNIGEEAGFADADMSIDQNLTDEIPGVLIDHTYDLNTLFGDIGAIYQFAFFESGGKLKFTRVSNTPIKAIGGCEFTNGTTGSGLAERSVTVADGETATVGDIVYTFKNTPAAPFDVKIETDTNAGLSTMQLDAAEKTAKNFLAAVAGDLSLASDTVNGFFSGTVKNPKVDVAATKSTTDTWGFTGLSFTAHIGGLAGNAIATSTTSGHLTMDQTHLHDGSEVANASVTLTIDDLCAVNEQQISQYDALITTINPAGIAQQAAAVTYYALEQQYSIQTQTYIPDDQNGAIANVGATTVTYVLPFVMSTSEAYARVAQTAIRAADQVVTQQFRLPQKYLLLEPSDVVAITLPPYQYQVRVDEATFNGDLSTSFSAANYTFRSDITVQDSDSQGNAWLPQSIPSAGDGVPVAVDMPILDARAGGNTGSFDLLDGIRALFNGFGQGSLNYGQVDAQGVEATSSPLLTTSHDVRWGTVVGSLPAAVEPYYRMVEDSITVACKTIIPSIDLLGGSYLDAVQGKNAILMGHPGAWELIYFRDVILVNSKVVTFTGLVRAQRGTDAAVAAHDETDVVILVASVAPGFSTLALTAQTLPASVVSDTYRFTAIGVPASRAPSNLDVTVQGLNLYPFSPCLLSATLVAGNDLDLAWVRRDRLSTAFVSVSTPMSEASEKYDLEIMSGSTVVRTVTDLTSPAYTYTSAQQTTDGFTPPLANLKFRVYQKGELGRGFPRLETVNVQ